MIGGEITYSREIIHTYIEESKKGWGGVLDIFLWALIVLLYWQIYTYIQMRQNLFRNFYVIITKKLAVSFNHTFRYIDDVLSINNYNFHNYVHLIYLYMNSR